MAPIPYIRYILSVGILIAGGWSIQGQTVIFADNFHAADGDFDSASLVDRTSGLDASDIQPQSTTVPQSIVGNQLQLTCAGGENTGASGGVRFVNSGNTNTQWDWSAEPGGDAIIKAGGMSVSFNWTSPDTTSTRWIFYAAGADPAGKYGTGWKLLAISPATSSGILFENNGTVQAWNYGVLTASNTFDATSSSNHVVRIDYQFDSWAAKAPVTANVFVDGKFMLTDTFTWKYGKGSQYMSFGTYQESNLIDTFNISTFPGTLASGFSSSTFVNKGELPWGAHQDAGTEWYCVTNAEGAPCVTMSNNVLTLVSYPIAENGFHYESGVVYAYVDAPDNGYNYVTVDVDLYTPNAGTAGCWPVFWLDSAKTWPPEVDVAEFKGNTGDGNLWQNVDGSDGKWVCSVSTIEPKKWHHYGVALGPPTGGARTYQLYCDGAVKGEGSFVDKQGVPYCVIFNYSMEGASGSPGPTEPTWVQAKNYKLAIH